uniref:Uncharacterized protein n=1 Tax=Solanum lycopersicum TaxID=4081 RepID=A0A3Q7GHM8_SOLLC
MHSKTNMWFDDEYTRHNFWLDGRFQDWFLNPYIPAFHVLKPTAMGSVITPLVFYNCLSRRFIPCLHGITLLGSLPKHCLNLSICFFLAAILINLVTLNC